MDKSHSYQDKGSWDVRRLIKIPSMRHEADSLTIIAVVDILPGVRKTEVDLNHHRLKVHYDASQVDFHRIKAELETAGYPAAVDLCSRFKEQWYGFVDTNMRENFHAPPPACCSKPQKRR